MIHLIVDQNHIKDQASKGRYSLLDFSMAWKNTIERQIGSCPVFDVEDNSHNSFEGAGVVVVSSSADSPDGEFIDKARSFVMEGGLLILETPSSNWNSFFDKDEKVNISDSQPEIIKTSGFGFADEAENTSFTDLKSFPIYSKYKEILIDVKKPLLLIDNKPAVTRFSFGKGFVILLHFDFAMALTAMKQGVPEDDFSVKEKRGKVPLIKEPDDLVLDESLLDNDVPFADILENFLFGIIDDLIFLPRLWYYPFEYDGALLMTHDDEKRGRKAAEYMIEEEAKRGFVSTFFVTCPPGAGKRWPGAGEMIEKGFDIQWHWNRFPDNVKIYSPSEQVSHFNKIEGVDLTSCRIHFLNLGDYFTEPFRMMADAGVRFDSTSGPNNGRGFLFGTAFPFSPLDTDGSLIDLLEFPFISQEDWAGADKDFVFKLIDESSEQYHGTLILLFHPHKKASVEGEVRDLWLGSMERAGDKNLWITTISELGRFFEKRRKVKIKLHSLQNRGEVEFEGLDGDMTLRVLSKYKEQMFELLADADIKERRVAECGREYILIKIL